MGYYCCVFSVLLDYHKCNSVWVGSISAASDWCQSILVITGEP